MAGCYYIRQHSISISQRVLLDPVPLAYHHWDRFTNDLQMYLHPSSWNLWVLLFCMTKGTLQVWLGDEYWHGGIIWCNPDGPDIITRVLIIRGDGGVRVKVRGDGDVMAEAEIGVMLFEDGWGQWIQVATGSWKGQWNRFSPKSLQKEPALLAP